MRRRLQIKGKYRRKEFEKLNGRKFGRLTVLTYAGQDKSGSRMWECRCECGKIKIIRGQSIKRGITKSCGCLQKEVLVKMLTKPKGVASFNYLFSKYKREAKRRGIGFKLDEGFFRVITKMNCFYCGKKPSQKSGQRKFNGHYIFNGIDRLNSKSGYTKDNCVPACGDCNLAKQSLTKLEFINLINRIYQHQKRSNNEKSTSTPTI